MGGVFPSPIAPGTGQPVGQISGFPGFPNTDTFLGFNAIRPLAGLLAGGGGGGGLNLLSGLLGGGGQSPSFPRGGFPGVGQAAPRHSLVGQLGRNALNLGRAGQQQGAARRAMHGQAAAQGKQQALARGPQQLTSLGQANAGNGTLQALMQNPRGGVQGANQMLQQQHNQRSFGANNQFAQSTADRGDALIRRDNALSRLQRPQFRGSHAQGFLQGLLGAGPNAFTGSRPGGIRTPNPKPPGGTEFSSGVEGGGVGIRNPRPAPDVDRPPTPEAATNSSKALSQELIAPSGKQRATGSSSFNNVPQTGETASIPSLGVGLGNAGQLSQLANLLLGGSTLLNLPGSGIARSMQMFGLPALNGLNRLPGVDLPVPQTPAEQRLLGAGPYLARALVGPTLNDELLNLEFEANFGNRRF